MSSCARTTSGRLRELRLVAWMAVFAGLFVASPTAFVQSGKVETHTIVMKDDSYTPDTMTRHVGDTVVITPGSSDASRRTVPTSATTT